MHHRPLALLLVPLASVATAQSPVWSNEGASKGGRFGTVVVLADVNGDAHSDIVVGSPQDDTNGPDAGKVQIFDGATGSLIRTHLGSQAGEQFGAAISCFDGNDDGFADYVVGAPFSDANGVDSGRIVAYSGANGAVLGSMNGVSAGDRFGSAISAGGGGLIFGAPHRVAVGAPYRDAGPSNCGIVYVLSGPPFAIVTSTIGSQANEHFGSAVELRSFTGTGTPPSMLLVGDPDYDLAGGGTDVGRVLLYSNLSSLTLELQVTGGNFAPGAHLGAAVELLSDQDGDGVLDVAMGIPDADLAGAGAGAVWVVSGKTGATIAYRNGVHPGDHFGRTLAQVHDIDIDGVGELAVGSPDEDVLGLTDVGVVRVLVGSTISKTFLGTAAGCRFGAGLSGSGDIDGDGNFEVAIGSPGADTNGPESGRVTLKTLDTGATPLTLEGAADGDQNGFALARVGDVDGDGIPDLLVGAPAADRTVIFPPQDLADAGRVRVLSGATGALIRTHWGAASFDALGHSVASLGDVNGDGVDDYVAGAPRIDASPVIAGYAVVYSGANGATIVTIAGPQAGDQFGFSVAGTGDVNGDGLRDLVVGAPRYDNGVNPETGVARVYTASTGALIVAYLGGFPGDQLGYSVAGLGGDATLDGHADILAGAPFYDGAAGSNTGRVRCFTSSGSTVYSREGDASGDDLGWSVVGGLDLNGDGKADWAAGAPNAGLLNSGMVRAYSTSGATLWTALGDPNSHLGRSVASAGDVDDDGRTDVAAGAQPVVFIVPGIGFVSVRSGKTGAEIVKLSGSSAGGQFGDGLAGLGDVDADGAPDLAIGAPGDDDGGQNAGLARVVSMRPTGTSPYGTGKPGCAGAHVFAANLVPNVGESGFELRCSKV
ncbi:MAG TPA: integrin alpha, partial [Planctomycetota bacterium]|nr:integrin alpha [Planctomycetota bacterium]